MEVEATELERNVMKVSVVMCTFRGVKYLEQQLNSLRLQTFPAHEVIIYDDYSDDDSVEVVQSFIDQYQLDWKLYVQPENVGYIKNFICALKKAKGELIFLCDQDDIWVSDKIEHYIYKFLEFENMLCLNSTARFIDAKNRPLRKQYLLDGQLFEVSFKDILFRNISMGCTMAFRRELLDFYLANTQGNAPHDWEMNAIAAMQEGLFYESRAFISYRVHENNTTGNDKYNHQGIKNRKRNATEMYYFIRSMHDYTAYMSREETSLVSQLTAFYRMRCKVLHGERKEWMTLCKQFGLYEKIVSKKGMFVDLLQSLRK